MRKYVNESGDLSLSEEDYGKDNAGTWYARPPGCHTGSLRNHQVTEHDDGTITVSPSILVTDATCQWHGYLVKGEWRKC